MKNPIPNACPCCGSPISMIEAGDIVFACNARWDFILRQFFGGDRSLCNAVNTRRESLILAAEEVASGASGVLPGSAAKLTDAHHAAMLCVAWGCDMRDIRGAKLLREIEAVAPGLVAIGPVMGEYGARESLPYFGVTLTDEGRIHIAGVDTIDGLGVRLDVKRRRLYFLYDWKGAVAQLGVQFTTSTPWKFLYEYEAHAATIARRGFGGMEEFTARKLKPVTWKEFSEAGGELSLCNSDERDDD